MACITVPIAEAIITSVAAKVAEKREKKLAAEGKLTVNENRIPLSRKLKWLNNLLWGGSLLLVFEHVWHGEIVPFFPFLTGAATAEDAAVMLAEIRTVGVTMAVFCTVAWLGILCVAKLMEKRADKPALATEEE